MLGQEMDKRMQERRYKKIQKNDFVQENEVNDTVEENQGNTLVPSSSRPTKNRRKQYLVAGGDEFQLFAGNEIEVVEGTDDSTGFSDEAWVHSSSSSDEELLGNVRRQFNKYMPTEGLNDPRFEIGMIFSNKKELKKAIIHHGIKWGRDLKFKKDDNIRVRARCKVINCKWEVHARNLEILHHFRLEHFNRNIVAAGLFCISMHRTPFLPTCIWMNSSQIKHSLLVSFKTKCVQN